MSLTRVAIIALCDYFIPMIIISVIVDMHANAIIHIACASREVMRLFACMA